jgi:hypothetical protein
MKISVAAIFVFLATAVYGWDSCESIRTAKIRTYGFHPPQLNDAGRREKSKQMDGFWNLVKASGQPGANCLRDLIGSEHDDHFFQFDGSSLLLALDHSDVSIAIILPAVQAADFADVDAAGYLRLVLQLSQNDADVGPLANKFLGWSKAGAFVPLHSLQLDRDSAALFLYASMPPPLADKYLIADLSASPPYVRSAAAHILAFQMTEEGFRALKEFGGTASIAESKRRKDIDSILHFSPAPALGQPKFTREQILAIIHNLPHTKEEFAAASKREEQQFAGFTASTHGDSESMLKQVEESAPIMEISDHTAFMKSAVATLTATDLDVLREARRKAIHSISDETLDEYFAYTQVILGIINRLDLYREYRTH